MRPSAAAVESLIRTIVGTGPRRGKCRVNSRRSPPGGFDCPVPAACCCRLSSRSRSFRRSPRPLPCARPSRGPAFDPALFGEMRWRTIGPFRGGRTMAAAGVPGQPNVFYIGVDQRRRVEDDRLRPHLDADLRRPAHGLDRRASPSRPSNPNMIYVGSGEGLQRPDLSTGDGIYKSTDGGKTWTHLGLRDGQQIPQIVVDPRDPNRLFVAVLGHPYGPNEERGSSARPTAARPSRRCSTRTRTPAAIDLALDPANPDIVYAALWEARQGPWENGVLAAARAAASSSPPTAAPPGGRSRRACPTFDATGSGRIGIARRAERPAAALRDRRRAAKAAGSTAPTTPARAGSAMNDDPRVCGRGGDFAEVKVDPTNPDVVYVANVVAWKSTDGGQDLHRLQGRARAATTTTASGSTPTTRDIMPARGRPGRDRHRQRRRDLELLVQPADRAVLPRHHRQRVPLPGLRRPAGERLGLRLEPRQRRPDHLPRLAPGRASRSTATSRPTRSTPTSSTAAR